VPDGIECGTLQACSSGACVASTTRRISSTLTTTYLRDDGSRQTAAGWDADISVGATVTSLVVPDSTDPTGYQTFPVTVGPDSGFAVNGVPFGTYFIQVDVPSSRNVTTTNPGGGVSETQVSVIERVLFEASSGAPDLSIVASKRPDAATSGADSPSVRFDLTGLAPIVAGDSLRLGSSDNILNVAFSNSSFLTPPKTGDTAIHSAADWGPFGVLPDASKGDSTWLWQRRRVPVNNGASLSNALAFAKATDFTVQATAGGTHTAVLSLAPQTGSFAGDVRWSQFAALGATVHPGVTPSSDTAPFIGFEEVPQSLTFPDQPLFELQTAPLFIDFFFGTTITQFPQTFFAEATFGAALPSATDVNYGTVAYAQFFDSAWHRAAQIFYADDAPLAASSGAFTITDAMIYRALVPIEMLPDPVVPELGPPTSPRINDNDAFAFQNSVGAQPTLSWSAPALGTATKYLVSVAPLKQFQTNDIASVTAVLYDQISLKLPPGTLDPTLQYYGTITAVQSPDKLDDPILGLGSPTYMANTVFGLFQP
jgi:hypothetical protein